MQSLTSGVTIFVVPLEFDLKEAEMIKDGLFAPLHPGAAKSEHSSFQRSALECVTGCSASV